MKEVVVPATVACTIKAILWAIKNKGLEKTLEDLNNISCVLGIEEPPEDAYEGMLIMLSEYSKT